MKPILYGPSTTDFDSNGIGVLFDAIMCEYEGAINGQRELQLKYPVNGLFYSNISIRSIIFASTGPGRNPQPFRVYRYTKPHNGIVTFYARHILYDTKKIICTPFSADNIQGALTSMKSAATTDCPFSFETSRTTNVAFSSNKPKSIWDTMGGTAGSLLDVYSGEWEFDGLKAVFSNRIGSDRGVSIRYGKNLTSLEQDENIADTYTGIYPYWIGQDSTLVQLPEKIIFADGKFDHTAIMDKDFSEDFEVMPTEDQLRSKTKSYISANGIGKPKVSIKVQFVDLSQTDEYSHIKILEQVQMGDTVNVVFPSLGVDSTSRVVKVKWNCLLDQYIRVELGSVRANLASTVAEQQKEIDKKPSVAMTEDIASRLSQIFLGSTGGTVRLLDTDGDGNPDELYIADNKDPDLAKKVWRWNYQGWAASKDGYNGPWLMGATLEDGLLAEFVTSAHLVAGTIESADGKTIYMDLDNGVFKADLSELSINGVPAVSEDDIDTVTNIINKSVADLQGQIDGNIIAHFESYDPTTSNKSASDWTTEDDKNRHANDTFTNTATGRSWRWAKVNNMWSWVYIEDTDVTKALADAARAQDTADKKRRVFVTTPVPPYDEGDLWAQGAAGDLMRCKTARLSGSYLSSDWERASKYTDDTAADLLDESLDQNGVFNRLTNNGSSQGIYIKNGNLYINASYIAAGILASKDGYAKINMETGEVSIGDENQFIKLSNNSNDTKSLSIRIPDIEIESVGSVGGAISTMQQTAGQVAVTVQTDEGVLKTEINPTTWQAAYKDAEGNEISGLHFDFEQKKFVFNGSGVFTGILDIGDGKFIVNNRGDLIAKGAVTIWGGRIFSFDGPEGGSLAMWNSELMVFRPQKEGETWSGAVARMGYPPDHPKYPYVHLGSTELDSEQITNFLIKRFDDGYWVGNALVVDDYGDFEPKEGCDGLFISTNGTFVVKDTNMQSVYTGEAIAKFG